MNIAWSGKCGIEEKRNAVTTLLKLRWCAKFTENPCRGRTQLPLKESTTYCCYIYVSTPEERNAIITGLKTYNTTHQNMDSSMRNNLSGGCGAQHTPHSRLAGGGTVVVLRPIVAVPGVAVWFHRVQPAFKARLMIRMAAIEHDEWHVLDGQRVEAQAASSATSRSGFHL